MNEDALTQLKKIVERAVRPVRASRSRKRRMREELLDHLTTVYQQERERTGDDRVAVEQAQRRFGDPGALTRELCASVPRWDCLAYVLDLERRRAGESLWHLAFRHVVISAVAMAGTFLLVLPLIWLRGRSSEAGLLLHILLVIGLFSAAFSFSFALVGGHMAEILYGRRPKRPLRAMMLCCLGSLAVFPVLAFLTYWGLVGSLASGLSGLLLGCVVAPAAPLLFFLQARQMQVEIQHESQWSDIQIEE